MPLRITSCRRLLLTLAIVGWGLSAADAQQTHDGNGRHYVYDQYVPPGVAGRMHLQAGNLRPTIPQQVRITLPAEGTVTFYDGSLERPVDVAAPAQVTMLVGLMYRMKVSGLEDFPHAEFFPSVELVGELHPPPGQAERFPIEIELLAEELQHAARGRMVTKVVYLEQADRVPLRNLVGTSRVLDIEVGQNAVAEADNLGRPVAIMRLGGRTPDANSFDRDQQFWGPLPPIRVVDRTAPLEPQTNLWLGPAGRPHPPIQRPALPVIPAASAAPSTSLR